jgi:hypothetical protein
MKRGPEVPVPSSAKKARTEDEEEFEIDTEELKRIETAMGIAGFDSSKGKNHSKSSVHGVMKVSRRRVREASKQLKNERKKKRRVLKKV